MTEYMIPSLKADMYLKGAKTWMEANPELALNPIERGLALRKVAKSIENRFGQMSYDTLFINKLVKDVGIWSSLSMGWKLGFFREFGGGILNEPLQAVRKLTGKEPVGGLRGIISRGELNRTMFVGSYVAMTMMYNAVKTYLNSGQAPQSVMDYVYPATGNKNPDGTDERESNPYYTREAVMIAKHIEHEGVLSGVGHYITSAAAPQIGLSWAFLSGVDHFGKEISDPEAGPFQQIQQRLAYAFGQVKPISIQALEKSSEKGPLTTKDYVNALFGFTPAPHYITQSSTDAKITALYQQYNAKKLQPFESVAKGEDRSKLRRLYLTGNKEEYEKKLNEMQVKYGMTNKDIATLVKDSRREGTVKMFSTLTHNQQLGLLKKMTPEEREKFLPKAHKETKKAFYDYVEKEEATQ
jgi:hypothetical protein